MNGQTTIGTMQRDRIYNMDCAAGLKTLPSESIDLVVSDVAYKVITGGREDDGINRPPQGILNDKAQIFEYNNIEIDEWMGEVYRVLKEGTHCYCYLFTNTLNLRDMLNKADEAGFQLHNLLVWEKNNCTPTQFYMKNPGYVLFLRKGKAKYINNIGREKLHPTQKPVSLLKTYILNSSKKRDVVLDMFMGSGSTAVTCLETGRSYIGFEIDKKYFTV